MGDSKIPPHTNTIMDDMLESFDSFRQVALILSFVLSFFLLLCLPLFLTGMYSHFLKLSLRPLCVDVSKLGSVPVSVLIVISYWHPVSYVAIGTSEWLALWSSLRLCPPEALLRDGCLW